VCVCVCVCVVVIGLEISGYIYTEAGGLTLPDIEYLGVHQRVSDQFFPFPLLLFHCGRSVGFRSYCDPSLVLSGDNPD